MTDVAHTSLLSPGDPAPVEVINTGSDHPALLVCEHAGAAVPAALNGLGLERDVLLSHRGWDIGAENVARRMAELLGAPLVVQRYSRLVIDCNRPPRAPQSILKVSDGAVVPGNAAVSAAAREARIDEIFAPLDREIAAQFRRRRACAISIHSFTREFAGEARPWHAGFLNRARSDDGERLMASVRAALPEAVLALNQPYRIEDDTDWFIPVHAEPRDIAHCLVEIRNDQIDDDAGADRWARILAEAVQRLLEELP